MALTDPTNGIAAQPYFCVRNSSWRLILPVADGLTMELQAPQQSDETHPSCEDALLLRNYDSDAAADITVTFEEPNGHSVYRNTYRISPLSTRSVDIPVAAGEYRVSAKTGSDSSVTAACRIGDGPLELASVEIGNGVVSVVSQAHLSGRGPVATGFVNADTTTHLTR